MIMNGIENSSKILLAWRKCLSVNLSSAVILDALNCTLVVSIQMFLISLNKNFPQKCF